MVRDTVSSEEAVSIRRCTPSAFGLLKYLFSEILIGHQDRVTRIWLAAMLVLILLLHDAELDELLSGILDLALLQLIRQGEVSELTQTVVQMLSQTGSWYVLNSHRL